MRSQASKTAGRALFAAGALCLAAATALTIWLAGMGAAATGVPHVPAHLRGRGDEGTAQIDWAAWKRINPDVVAWIRIPGTAIDHPLVQAPKSDPTFYLKHDVYRSWNVYGTPYLDASCEEGIDSPNLVVFGHHMNDESMFSPVAEYASPRFSETHCTIIVQTPRETRTFAWEGTAIIRGDEASKQTDFASREEFLSYHDARLSACDVRRAQGDGQPEQMLTLVTCSYHHSDDERTVVYAKR